MQFDLQAVERIKQDLEKIQRFAAEHYREDQILFGLIDHLSGIAAILAENNEQAPLGNTDQAEPLASIQGRLAAAAGYLRQYEKRINQL